MKSNDNFTTIHTADDFLASLISEFSKQTVLAENAVRDESGLTDKLSDLKRSSDLIVYAITQYRGKLRAASPDTFFPEEVRYIGF